MKSDQTATDTASQTEQETRRNTEKRNSANYKRKTAIIHQVSFIFCFAFLLFGLFYPWSISRSTGFEIGSELHKYHLKHQVTVLTTLYSNILNKYQSITEFILLLTEEPKIIETTPEMINRFIRLAHSIHSYLDPPQKKLILGHESSTFYQIEFLSDTEYNLTSLEIDTTLNKFVLKQYIEPVGFRDEILSLPQGETIRVFDENPIDFSQFVPENSDGHHWASSFSFLGDLSPTNDFGSLSYKNFSTFSTSQIYVLSTAPSGYFRDLLKKSVPSFFCEYIIFDFEGNIAISSVEGLNQTKIISNPLLSKAFEAAFTNGTLSEANVFTFEEVDYISILQPIIPRDQPLGSILLVFSLDEAVELIFTPTTLILLIVFIIEELLFFIIVCLLQQNQAKASKKLMKQQTPQNNSNNSLISMCGPIGHSIHKLRNLQLLYPEELILNKVIDTAVTNLTEMPTKRYIELNPNHPITCPFCQHLIEKESFNNYTEPSIPKSFTTWHFTTFKAFPAYKGLGEINFDIEKHKKNPIYQLLCLSASIIERENLIFPQLDPDGIIQCIAEIAQKSVNPIELANALYNLFYLTNGPFRHWISSKIDLFSLYSTIIFYFDPVNKGQYTEDNLEISEKQISDILNIIHKFIKFDTNADPMLKRFKDVVLMLIQNSVDIKQFDILGLFRIRIESPEFSAFSNGEDRVLFMEVLFRFCLFSPYWSKLETMKSLLVVDETCFTKEELANVGFAQSYYYEMAVNIVEQWIKVFESFTKLGEIRANHTAICNYWERERNNLIPDELDEESLPESNDY